VGTLGSALSGETAEEDLLLSGGGERKLLNSLGAAVDTLGEGVDVDVDTGGGVLLVSFFAVNFLVLDNNGEDLLGLFLLVLAINYDFLGTLDGAVGGSAGSIVEVSLGQRVVSPLVVVELFEESIVVLGEGPNNAVRSLHFYIQCLSIMLSPHS